MNDRVFIHAAAALGPRGDYLPTQRQLLNADPPPLALKELTRTITGQHLRQASHFVELAAIGAGVCARRAGGALPADTAVYLGTGLAEVRKNAALFAQTLNAAEALVSPFDFINSANNMAAFYVAKLAGLHARNLTVTQEMFSFERALELAYADLRTGRVAQALVGGVDEAKDTRAEQLRHLPLRTDQRMGEGAGWLYLHTRSEHARGELISIDEHVGATADDIGRLARQSAAHRRHGEALTWLPGMGLTAADRTALAHAFHDGVVEDYLAYCGCFFTAAAFGIAMACERGYTAPQLLIHINRDSEGRVMAVAIRLLPGTAY